MYEISLDVDQRANPCTCIIDNKQIFEMIIQRKKDDYDCRLV